MRHKTSRDSSQESLEEHHREMVPSQPDGDRCDDRRSMEQPFPFKDVPSYTTYGVEDEGIVIYDDAKLG